MRRNVNPTASNMLKMVWNKSIADNAKKWADNCSLTVSPNEMRTIDGVLCGENVFMASYPSSWSNAIQEWHDAGSNFEYGVGAIDPKKSIYGYTQIVWYNSYQVGCAVAYCPHVSFPYFYVCQYCPAGNIVSQLVTPYKKGPSCGDCPNNCENKLCTNPCKHVDVFPHCQQLLQLFSCTEKVMTGNCLATCNCQAEIK
ncbi:serotriflin-like isoform X2 [Paroedura picta]